LLTLARAVPTLIAAPSIYFVPLPALGADVPSSGPLSAMVAASGSGGPPEPPHGKPLRLWGRGGWETSVKTALLSPAAVSARVFTRAASSLPSPRSQQTRRRSGQLGIATAPPRPSGVELYRDHRRPTITTTRRRCTVVGAPMPSFPLLTHGLSPVVDLASSGSQRHPLAPLGSSCAEITVAQPLRRRGEDMVRCGSFFVLLPPPLSLACPVAVLRRLL
jgi:hypothetical protein